MNNPTSKPLPTVTAKLSDLADRFDEIRVCKVAGKWTVTVIDSRASFSYTAPELGRALTGLYSYHLERNGFEST